MVERDFDLMIYGASGFVGRRAVRYVAAHAQASGLRWAIAGRDRAKLEPLAEASGGIPVLVAAANDRAAIEAIVARTRVVLAMAGPFSLYADNLVDACVRLGTDYTDITGETPWIKSLIDRHHERAAEAGTRIVPACGFDSVPSDIGAYVVARYAQRELAVESADVKAFFQASGGLNGGTLATLMQVARDPVQGAQLRDPVVASFDADVVAWIAPFVMGPINTRVVRRSAALFAQWGERYGPNFAYQEYMAFPGPFGAALATTVAAGTVLAQTSLALGSTRGLLQPLVPKPGTGPSEYAIEHGWFRCELFARTAGARCVRGLIADRGDPGNAATVKFACEAAFALALDKAELPGGASRGGVLTPATALGDVLVRRLHDAGMTLEASLAV